jgi:S1-C subfamily serine protease
MSIMLRALIATITIVLSVAPPASGESSSHAIARALHAASVVLEDGGCSGVLAESAGIVLTARHCVHAEGQELHVRFTDGTRRTAWVEAIDQDADQALLVLDEPVAIEPLMIVRRRQIPGTVLYFEGNPSRPRFQRARLDKIGRCPSLPDLPNALFTSIHGTPGDSGAPLVDGAARVVGLVHGGAQCEIATPADTLGRLLDRVLEEPPLRAAPQPRPPSQG